MSKYNGWANYATWRINLELIAGDERWTERAIELRNDGDGEVDAYDLAQEMKESTEELVSEGASGIALDYALSFMANVDWIEIARSVIDDLDEYESEE